MRRLAILALAAAALALGAAPAHANRSLSSTSLLNLTLEPPPPEGEIEGACGLALTPSNLLVSDYYHRVVDRFDLSTDKYVSQIALPGGRITGFGRNSLDGVCGLATGPGGTLYANEWHQGVSRLLPSTLVFDEGESTGVATDAAGHVYIDDRTHVAVYEPTGVAVEVGGEPLTIGEEHLGDAYGLAVSPDGARVYVADASTDTVKVFEPAVDPTTPAATISHGFVSLTDAALAVDPSNEHLLVVDNVQPGFQHPLAAIYEFDAAGAFLAKLPGSPVFGGPSGIAVSETGSLYVTDGNSERSNVYLYSPYVEGGFETGVLPSPDASAGPSAAPGQPVGPSAPTSESAAAASSPGERGAGQGGSARAHSSGKGQSSLVQKGPIRVKVSGGLAPTRLPRQGAAPVNVSVGGLISSSDPSDPPQLRKVSFEFNRVGRLDARGLPRCRLTDIDPSSTRQALAACRDALVGEGHFAANVLLPEQSPFPSEGKVLAFNGVLHGKQVIFAHIYGTEPVPTSIVLTLRVHRISGTFGTRMDASFAGLTGDWGYVRSIGLRLGRKFSYRGASRSFLSAGCPAPKGFPGAVFPLARASFSFSGDRTLSATLTRSCRVRR